MRAERRYRTGLAVVVVVLATAALAGAQAAPTPRGTGQSPTAATQDDRAPILWLERVNTGQQKEGLPLLRAIPPTDARIRDAERLVDNEAASFTRTLVAWAWRTFPPPADWAPPRLAVVLADGGNNAEQGFRLQEGDRIEEHPQVPYLLLQLDTASLSNTFIHEGGHLLHRIVTSGRQSAPWWTATVHSTFAVTDPLTALSEGYAIHFETLWAHYGKQREMRAFYHRLAPSFDTKGRRAEYYAPIADLMTVSQTWARYEAVRDTWPSFAGHVYPGDYLRSQYDPARDRATLKTAGAMLASEGVVASTFFWTIASLAAEAGAKPAEGLDQQPLIVAEHVLLRALSAPSTKEAFRPDVIDVLAAFDAAGSPARATAISRFLSVTRGVTAQPGIRAKWAALYHDALTLDFDATRPLFTELDGSREAIVRAALQDASTLRRMIGSVLPVRAPKVMLELKAVGRAFELDFDLNAAGEAEWLAAGVDAQTVRALTEEAEKKAFSSIADFEKRTGRSLKSLGLIPVER